MKILPRGQKGIGLMEILIALLLLAIGILGFIALQYRSLEATSEATYRVQAVNLARDLSERIRVNPNAASTYKTEVEGAVAKQKTASKNCYAVWCSSTELADFDVQQVYLRASSVGMTLNMRNCEGNSDGRNCIYVAWGETAATDGSSIGNCTDGTSYRSDSTCIVMESY